MRLKNAPIYFDESIAHIYRLKICPSCPSMVKDSSIQPILTILKYISVTSIHSNGLGSFSKEHLFGLALHKPCLESDELGKVSASYFPRIKMFRAIKGRLLIIIIVRYHLIYSQSHFIPTAFVEQKNQSVNQSITSSFSLHAALGQHLIHV